MRSFTDPPSRCRYLVSVISQASGSGGPSLADLADEMAVNDDIRIVDRLGAPDRPHTLVVDMSSAEAERLKQQFPGRVLVEFDHDRATALPTPRLPPRHREVALGTAHLLLVPVHRKLFERVRALDLRLPPLAGACGAPQGDALFVTAVDE